MSIERVKLRCWLNDKKSVSNTTRSKLISPKNMYISKHSHNLV